ncbi:hypothetical protein BGZ61DRAFT_529219 [Ilyonectria robusta]|uniref:uncharacterized protein n=1 Tax=Ilyonectria robusta TaxID=1079257 RepID=UPI001E8DEC6C|nr:uncharacterized protein BGZ61DRAFT_529219 [Ilyonectria robusta]KAH8734002.1 hypothetical protein BGZ61DRAFT_529219 [Ilyonectria robusta]
MAATLSTHNALITPPPALLSSSTVLDRRRQLTIDEALCGWIWGIQEYSHTCPGYATCFFNSQRSLQVCASDAVDVAYTTACVESTNLSLCGTSCWDDRSTLKCSSASYPRCITMSWSFGGNPYFNLACGKTGASNIYGVELTYTGFTMPIHLPFMVDNYGAVTENTIFPSPTAAPPEFTETGWADPGGTVSSTDARPTTTAANPADQGSSPSDLGFREIIAIVVPICTLVFGALGLCFKYSAWKRDRRDRFSY